MAPLALDTWIESVLPRPPTHTTLFGHPTPQEAQTVHQEVHLLLAKACEMLIDDLAARGWVVAAESNRKCLQVRAWMGREGRGSTIVPPPRELTHPDRRPIRRIYSSAATS